MCFFAHRPVEGREGWAHGFGYLAHEIPMHRDHVEGCIASHALFPVGVLGRNLGEVSLDLREQSLVDAVEDLVSERPLSAGRNRDIVTGFDDARLGIQYRVPSELIPGLVLDVLDSEVGSQETVVIIHLILQSVGSLGPIPIEHPGCETCRSRGLGHASFRVKL